MPACAPYSLHPGAHVQLITGVGAVGRIGPGPPLLTRACSMGAVGHGNGPPGRRCAVTTERLVSCPSVRRISCAHVCMPQGAYAWEPRDAGGIAPEAWSAFHTWEVGMPLRQSLDKYSHGRMCAGGHGRLTAWVTARHGAGAPSLLSASSHARLCAASSALMCVECLPHGRMCTLAQDSGRTRHCHMCSLNHERRTAFAHARMCTPFSLRVRNHVFLCTCASARRV